MQTETVAFEIQIVRCVTGTHLHRSLVGKASTFCGKRKASTVSNTRGALCPRCFRKSAREVGAAIVAAFSVWA